MNSFNIDINKDDKDFATNVSNFASSPIIKRHIADAVLAVRAAGKYFDDLEADVDTTSLCCTEDLIQVYNIVDIYINGFYVDIITITDSTDYLVPSIHFSKHVTPLAYMFMQYDEENDNYTVLGFVLTEDIDTTSVQDGYYLVDKSFLHDFAEIEYMFSGHVEETLPSDFKKQTFDYFDGISSDIDRYIKTLLNSAEARKIFLSVYKAKSVFNYISIPENNKRDMPERENSTSVTEDNFDETTDDIMAYESSFDAFTTNVDSINIADMSEEVADADTKDEILNQISDISIADSQNGIHLNEQEVTAQEQYDVIEENSDIEHSSENIKEDLYSSEIIEEQNYKKEEFVEELIPEEKSIDALYNNQNNALEGIGFTAPKKRHRMLPIIVIILLIAFAGYFGYTKFYIQRSPAPALKELAPEQNNTADNESMPVETIENEPVEEKTEEAINVSVPAIEKNLDTSILIENLSVNWRVPTGYVSNSLTKRYFTRVGKIIQLNLKTELLLLSKSPLSDKIEVELEFNKETQSFEIKELITASGEKTIDDLVKHITEKALNITKIADMNIFGKISGNPVLIIHF